MYKRLFILVVSVFVMILISGLCLPISAMAESPPPPAERELIKGGDLKSLQGWVIHQWMNPVNRKDEVTLEGDGVKFMNTSVNSRMGIMQAIEVNVSGARSLKLTARVKADVQKLDGTGWQGREAPIAVMVTYTDEKGVLRNGLGSMANPPEPQANRMFWNGFYYADPTGNSRNWNGTKVVKGQWFTYTVDLMTLDPKPKIIHAVGAEGSGWPTRQGKIAFISLKAVLGPPPPPPPPPEPVNLTGVWNCNDGGKYYIRQLGNKIWWYGEQSPTNPAWSNVSHGDIVGKELRLDWADVPKGHIMGSGILVLDLSMPGRITANQKTGGFGGSIWTR